MAALENVFSWSKSRNEQFRDCQRKYFYDKYASWGGWDRSAPEKMRMAYILKNLKNRWAWKGESVHHIIEEVLKSTRQKKTIPIADAIALLTSTMRDNYRSSKTKKYMEDPKRNLGLFEHEYEKPVSDAVWKTIHDESVQCLKGFYHSALYAELLEDDVTSWLLIEDLEEFDFEGSKVYVKLDFARKKNGQVEIYDWKTGKTDGDTDLQMGAYAIYAMQKWKIPLSEIRAYILNLSAKAPAPEMKELSDEIIEKARVVMRASIAGMKTLLSDPKKNIPKPEDEFRFTDQPRFCDFCSFLKICAKFQTPK